MARPTLSVYGLYQYDNSLFDDLHIPEGMNKETLVDNILLECAELETIYPALPFLKIAIGKWSDKELPVWEKLYETTQYEYDPIYNKDAHYTETETETRDLHGSSSQTASSQSTETRNLQNSKTTNLTDQLTNDLAASKTDTNKVSAYDSNTYQNREQTESSATDTGTATTTHTGTETIKDTGTDATNSTGTGSASTTDSGTITRSHNRREYGNIGVTTTQRMILEERDIDKFNIYDFIVNQFKMRFCILVY